ncbi:hypothetical protein PR202_gn00042 [Eleusine coracana subsp. coracana]|uniref:Uncharacterized protein n=1 Tax=Eleusine coracana subsp. coracana TaxID=191504 RepID=A0AAV5G1I7_ELECO|nr:hypothetical protein PR202_gn00042 [Eleusine coracana subsp. coracana]
MSGGARRRASKNSTTTDIIAILYAVCSDFHVLVLAALLGDFFIISGLYLVTWAHYKEAQQTLTVGYLDPLLASHPCLTAPKTHERSLSTSIDP